MSRIVPKIKPNLLSNVRRCSDSVTEEVRQTKHRGPPILCKLNNKFMGECKLAVSGIIPLSQCFRDSKFFQILFWGTETAHIAPSSTSGYGRGEKLSFIWSLTPLNQVFLCKHSTSLIHNLLCLELSGLRSGRSTWMFWYYLYTALLLGVIPSSLNTACDLGQAVFSNSDYSRFYCMETHLLSVARWNPHYKSKFLGGRTFQSNCGNTGSLGLVFLSICFSFLGVYWYSVIYRRQAANNGFVQKLQHTPACRCVVF